MMQKNGEGQRTSVDGQRKSAYPVITRFRVKPGMTTPAEPYAHTGLPSEQFLHISMLLRDSSSERLKSL